MLEDAENKPLLVEDLLQKPCAEEMVKRGAVNLDGTALLDTGIFIVVGDAWHGLVAFALSDPNPVTDVIATGNEVGGLRLFCLIKSYPLVFLACCIHILLFKASFNPLLPF